MATVTMRYFAAARAASGVDEEHVTLDEPVTIERALKAVTDTHGDELARVLTRCSYLHNAVAVRDVSAPVADGDQVDVLPPFAGG